MVLRKMRVLDLPFATPTVGYHAYVLLGGNVGCALEQRKRLTVHASLGSKLGY